MRGRARVVTPTRLLDEFARKPGRVVDVERWTKRLDDRLLNVSRGRVLAPGHKQVPDHPLRQPPLVVVDQDDAVRPSGAVELVFEHKPGECASQSRATASTEVVASRLRSFVARPM